jgi:hypothetical protein
LAILSADYEGRNDLYLLSSRRDRIRRLTNDVYDDLDPSFIPNTNKIVFSSNRTSDSLNQKTKPALGSLTDNYNLYVFDLDTTKNVVDKITNTLSKDYSPIALNSTIFYYLSDQRGIINLFRYDRSTKIYTQVTNFSTSIKDFDFNVDNSTFAMITNRKMKDEIYVNRNINLNRQVFTPATRRKELQQARVVHARRKQEENKNMSIRDLINARLKNAQQNDSTKTSEADSLTHSKDSTAVLPGIKADTLKPKQTEVVNTDNYVFEDEAIKETKPAAESFLTRYMKTRDKNSVQGPFPYESRFSADNLITSFVIDPMRGFGVAIERQMNDMLENYRLLTGLMTTVDLRNGDFYATSRACCRPRRRCR